ncbi:MAG TPA: right-handed parallel beta-helix repeat-containing protein [Solirubrobacteraceae bacterium]|nr:right-handed parallel beta-helix repeat-containing protein [Solirubrobacteraceae bacterium]
MSRRGIRAGSIGLCALLVALVGSATASANTLWVSTATPSAPFNSCTHPGYDSLQSAVNGPGTTIRVCAGTYEEQVQIERSVTIIAEGATLKLPATTATSTTPCDKANEAIPPGLPDQDAVSICGGVVTISGLKLDAIWPGEPVGSGVSCAYNLTGILVAGGAKLTLTNSTIIGAAPQQINGCQYGLGILVGIPGAGAIGAATATITNVAVHGYNKNGITVAGEGASAKISKATVEGVGPTSVIAQNGIGVQEGAKATITGVETAFNECNDAPACGPNPVTQYGGDGVYFYDAGAGSKITGSISYSNDIGVEAYDAPSTDPMITSDTVEGNRFSAVQIGEGTATVNNDTLTESNVGIQLVQFEGQKAAVGGTASHDTITDMSKWAVLGSSDNAAGDLFGEFSITGSKISGNPGPTPQKSVETENPAKLKIYAEKDH